MRERGWDTVVLKPTVSAGALKTYRFHRSQLEAAQSSLDQLAAEGEVMVQPYLTAFETQGERAYLFFDGAFSHAVRLLLGIKDLPRGFAQPHLFEPIPEELRLAEDVLAAVRPAPALRPRGRGHRQRGPPPPAGARGHRAQPLPQPRLRRARAPCPRHCSQAIALCGSLL